MKKFARRDRMKIYRDLLVIIEEETKRGKVVLTRIQQKAHVPFDRLKAYLSELKELGLIQNESSPKITEKGRQYMTEYEKVIDFMKRMGLTYRR